MFNLIRQVLQKGEDAAPGGTHDRDQRTRIAAGVILLEAAQADYTCTEEEIDHVVDTLRRDFDLSEKHAEELLDLAHRAQNRAVDLFEFTNHINEEFSKTEKKSVLEAVWLIILADGQLDQHEEHFARKLTNLLRLSHKDMIDAKLKARIQVQ